MAEHSAGILLFRRSGGELEVLLGHMGGPFWRRKDGGAWSAPKGLLEPGEDHQAAARREFTEEVGVPVPDGELIALGTEQQRGGKVVTLWAIEADLDVSTVRPGTFDMEWPPKSGRTQSFPEVDRAEWIGVETARAKLVGGQRVFLDRLITAIEAE
ncbi:MAG: NUDIX domain-containing protein [Jatrophihabitans sp.]